MRGRDVFAAFSDDLAFGEGPFDRRGREDDLVWPAVDRTASGALQRVRTFGVGRSAARQRRGGDSFEAGAPRPSAGSPCPIAARRRALDERQSGALDGGRVGFGAAGAATRLGSVAGDRLVDPEAAAAQPEGGDAGGARRFQKKLAEVVAEEAARHPDTPIETFATDEHRIGLKPVIRRVWAPIGARPTAHGHHRFEWLYVTAFVSPATGESFWYVSNGVSKPFFEALLRLFAEEAGAGRERVVILVLDNAGWHGEAGLVVPQGVRLVFQPAYTPELQPAETLWTLVDEPVVNKHVPTLDDLDEIVAARCAALVAERQKIRSQAGFHWWPKIVNPR